MRKMRWRKGLKWGRMDTTTWHSQKGKVFDLGRLSFLEQWKHALKEVALLEAQTNIAASIRSVESRENNSVVGSNFSWVSTSFSTCSSFCRVFFYWFLKVVSVCWSQKKLFSSSIHCRCSSSHNSLGVSPFQHGAITTAEYRISHISHVFQVIEKCCNRIFFDILLYFLSNFSLFLDLLGVK